MTNPLVSIVIPVYNGSNYLSQAIDSALTQTYKNIEILVVNDGSKDDGATEKVALSYGDKIRYFSKENGGVSSALNLGIKNMKGDYFSWLSHDDMYTPEKIQNQVSMINEDNRDKIQVCDTAFVDADSKPLTRNQKHIKSGSYSNTQMLSEVFSGYNISGCALLIPKSAFDKAGLFNKDIKYMQDMEMWYRMMINGIGFYVSDKGGVLSRVHSQQTTVTGKNLGVADQKIVGTFMVENLNGMFNGNENLLKKYMYLCYRNNSIAAGNYAVKLLKENKQLSLLEFLKAYEIKLYGQIRPLLVKAYYKVFFRIKVK